jgi:hypothetical protein
VCWLGVLAGARIMLCVSLNVVAGARVMLCVSLNVVAGAGVLLWVGVVFLLGREFCCVLAWCSCWGGSSVVCWSAIIFVLLFLTINESANQLLVILEKQVFQ